MLAAAAAVVVLLQKPVRVVARPIGRAANTYDCEITVSAGGRNVRIETMPVAPTWTKASAAIRERVQWKNDYLFVGTDCGGGNAYCCYAERVFALQNGVLVDFGHVCPRDAHGAGSSFDGTRFIDEYDRLEGNALTPHAESPEFPIVRVRSGNALVTDRDATWQMNQAAFDGFDVTLKKAHRGQYGLRQHILFNAALAKYCGRRAELRQTMSLARQLLTREERSRLGDALDDVKEGGPPHRD